MYLYVALLPIDTIELKVFNKMPNPGILESRDLGETEFKDIFFTQLFFKISLYTSILYILCSACLAY